jgi:hypothetical protein
MSRPVSVVDPTGMVGYIWQSGNNISIVIPIAFSGGTFDQRQAMAAAITATWTGRFEQYNVVTTVIDGSSMNIPVNAISIAPGSRDAHGLSRVFGDAKSGLWFGQPSRSQCLDYAHEAGHLLGLGEHPDSQTIMDNVYTTSVVTPDEIQAILDSPFNVVEHVQ